jgi:hypothetical protein
MTLPYLHIYLFAAHLFRRVVFGSILFARLVGIKEWAVQCNVGRNRGGRSGVWTFVRLEDEEEAGRIGLLHITRARRSS